MMKRFIILMLFAAQFAYAQQPQVYVEPEQYYKKGYDLFTKEKYGAAILEFDKALKQAEIEQQSKMCYIEIFTGQMDLPFITQKICESIKKSNNKANKTVQSATVQ